MFIFRYRNEQEIESDEHIRIETNEEGQVSSTLVIEHFTKDDVAEVSKLRTMNFQSSLEDYLEILFFILVQMYC